MTTSSLYLLRILGAKFKYLLLIEYKSVSAEINWIRQSDPFLFEVRSPQDQVDFDARMCWPHFNNEYLAEFDNKMSVLCDTLHAGILEKLYKESVDTSVHA